MKIYFSASVTGGRNDAPIYSEIVRMLKTYGEVLSEKNGDLALTSLGDTDITDEDIYKRDIRWLKESDVIVAEVTTPSLGVGYEVASASFLGKKVLCIYREIPQKRVSAMIRGDKKLIVKMYKTADELKIIFDNYLK